MKIKALTVGESYAYRHGWGTRRGCYLGLAPALMPGERHTRTRGRVVLAVPRPDETWTWTTVTPGQIRMTWAEYQVKRAEQAAEEAACACRREAERTAALAAHLPDARAILAAMGRTDDALECEAEELATGGTLRVTLNELRRLRGEADAQQRSTQ